MDADEIGPNNEDATSETTLGHERGPLRRVGDRGVAAGLEVYATHDKHYDGDSAHLKSILIEFPEGDDKRSIILDSDEALKIEQVHFESWVFLGSYQAILDPTENEIVADISTDASASYAAFNIMETDVIDENDSDIAIFDGLERSEHNVTSLMPRAPSVGTPSDDVRFARIEAIQPSGKYSVTLQWPAPPQIRATTRSSRISGAGIRIHGISDSISYDDALKLLINLSTSFFVDLDINYGVVAQLATDPLQRRHDERDREQPAAVAPRFPILQHNNEVASLYLYARKLIDTPVLEYLAYYQVVEFHMPMYARTAAIRRLRESLKNPRFSHDDDVALGRLVDELSKSAGNSKEREQLQVTITACLVDSDIEHYMDNHPKAEAAFRDKQYISGVQLINRKDKQASLSSQIATRIYDLRCRIVHGKDGGTEQGGSPLRPFSREARSLTHDLRLLRFVAQCVLIASSKAASWT